MSRAQQVGPLPPTLGITDPHVRAFCDALASAWNVRNNGIGKDDERFVRKGEIADLATRAVIDTLSGAPNAIVTSLQPGSGSASELYNQMLTAVERLVTGSRAYEFLRTPIQQIKPPTKQLQELRDRIDKEVNDRVAAIELEAAERGSGIYDESTSRVTDVDNLQSQINTIIAVGTGDTATILAALTAEQTARVAGDTAEATSRSLLAAQMRGTYTGTDVALVTTGLVYSERQARVTAVGAVASSVSALTARMGTAEAAIVTEQSARVSGVSAVASNVTALTARMGTAEANILTNNSTRSTKDNSLAQAINTIWTKIGGASALIQDASLAAVSPAAVTATKWNQVQAAVTDPNTGLVNAVSIKSELNAYVSKVDGSMNTTWAVRSNVSGIISGLALMTTAGAGSAPGAATSNFMIMANRLSLVSPSNNALRPVPFSVDGAGNAVFSGTVYAAAGVFGGSLLAATGTFNGALSAATGTFTGALSAATGTFSGTLTAAAINAVNTINLAGNSVSVSAGATGTGSSGVSVVLHVPAGQTMEISAIATAEGLPWAPFYDEFYGLELTIDGNTVTFRAKSFSALYDDGVSMPYRYFVAIPTTSQHVRNVTGPKTVTIRAKSYWGETPRVYDTRLKTLIAIGRMK